MAGPRNKSQVNGDTFQVFVRPARRKTGNEVSATVINNLPNKTLSSLQNRCAVSFPNTRISIIILNSLSNSKVFVLVVV